MILIALNILLDKILNTKPTDCWKFKRQHVVLSVSTRMGTVRPWELSHGFVFSGTDCTTVRM